MWRQLALVALIVAAGSRAMHAHAALVISDPLDRVALGDAPASVRLSFSERPDPALSEIRVLDTAGAEQQLGRPLPTTGDPLTLFVNLRPLDRGVYTVSWRTVSAVDGHPSEGSYAFGVRVEPASTPGSPAAAPVSASLPEGAARWLLIAGLIGLLGGGVAALARFGPGSGETIALWGCVVAAVGLILLAVMQTRNAQSTLQQMLASEVGRALLWRGAALAIAAIALLRKAIAVTVAATLATVAVHVANGHAAADQHWFLATASQWAHFSAAGVWFGGLLALLLAVRGQTSTWKAEATHRFSRVATLALVVVAVTGVIRTVGEISGWRDLTSTPYGLAILAKVGLTIGIVGFAAFNHWRSVATAATNLQPLRRAGTGELSLAAGALAAAALLGALPPPAQSEPTGLVASGADYATTVRVRLATPSNQPGPNRFVVSAADYDSGRAIDARRVSLRFTPIDDPDVATTTLELARAPDGSFVGSGGNLAFGGRWRISALIERTASSVEVPMVVETAAPPQFVAVAHLVGQPTTYRIQVLGTGHVWISPDPERAGKSAVTIAFWDLIQDPQPMRDVVITLSSGDEPPREQSVKRTSRASFVADVAFARGANRLAVVGRAINGRRIRAVLNLDIAR